MLWTILVEFIGCFVALPACRPCCRNVTAINTLDQAMLEDGHVGSNGVRCTSREAVKKPRLSTREYLVGVENRDIGHRKNRLIILHAADRTR